MKTHDWYDAEYAAYVDQRERREHTSLERGCERGWVIFCAVVVALAFLCAQVQP